MEISRYENIEIFIKTQSFRANKQITFIFAKFNYIYRVEMKDQLSIIIAVAAIAFAGVRLYQKYIKKETQKGGTGNTGKKSSGFPSSQGKDDYEPYSKK